mmetsp:Transcript_8019/g.14138  ORF Transcript_8019/g.14138 Transcript_8019/m.14138 type:complete len:80 (-) Transcript_8019:27-266(-)
MDETIQLASENIANFYEEKLATLKDELNQAALAKDDLSMENKDLRAKLEKTKDVADHYHYQQELIGLNSGGKGNQNEAP